MNSELLKIIMPIMLQGLIYSLVVMGIYVSSRVIQFDDLTTEGSFSFGGAISAIAIFSGLAPWIAIPLAVICGALAGLITGLLHTKMKLNNLICGLIVTTALFSICLKLAGANLSFGDKVALISSESPYLALIILGLFVAIAFWSLKMLFKSEVGLLLRALGNNPQMLTNLGKSVQGYKLLGLMISNSLTALGGALFVQYNGFYSITGSIGTLVIGLTGLILSEIIKPVFGVGLIIGAILYQTLFAVTIELELDPVWNNLIKALLIVFLIQIKSIQKKASQKKMV